MLAGAVALGVAYATASPARGAVVAVRFRTAAGAHAFCTLGSYLGTARKQGRDGLGVLRDSLAGHPFIPAVPWKLNNHLGH